MDAAGQILAVARWQFAEASLGELLELAAELRAASLAEPGCLGYEYFRDDGGLVLLERYRDDAALEAHRQSAHYRRLVVERILPMLTGRRVELFRPRDPA